MFSVWAFVMGECGSKSGPPRGKAIRFWGPRIEMPPGCYCSHFIHTARVRDPSKHCLFPPRIVWRFGEEELGSYPDLTREMLWRKNCWKLLQEFYQDLQDAYDTLGIFEGQFKRPESEKDDYTHVVFLTSKWEKKFLEAGNIKIYLCRRCAYLDYEEWGVWWVFEDLDELENRYSWSESAMLGPSMEEGSLWKEYGSDKILGGSGRRKDYVEKYGL